MFESFKGRNEPLPGQRVRVYRNLNKPAFYSILAMGGDDKGKVVGYAKAVSLTDIEFLVSEKTRNKVLEKQCRTVHAYAQGLYESSNETLPETFTKAQIVNITYQPFINAYFFARNKPDKALNKIKSGCLFGADCVTTEEIIRNA